VIGITGQQGGAVAQHLLKGGWKVRGLSRDMSKPAVQALLDAGPKLSRAIWKIRLRWMPL